MQVRRLNGKKSVLACALAASLFGTASQAATLYWDGTGTSWNSAANWSTDPAATTPDPAAPPGILDLATFNITGLNTAQTVNLDANQAALGLVSSSTGTVAIQGGGTSRTLTLGASGILLNAGAGAMTIGSSTAGQEVALALTGSQTWNNNSGNTSANAITINNNVDYGAGGAATLTLNANTANTTINSINGSISNSNGTLALTVNGSGGNARWFLSGANTYSGLTTVNNGGAIRLTNGQGLGSTAAGTVVNAGGVLFLENNITVAGEALELTGDGLSGSGNGAIQSIAGINRWTADIKVNTGTTTGRIGAINAATLILDGTITGTGTGQLVFQTGSNSSNSGTIIVNGDISFAGQRLTKSATGSGTGTVILNGNNNFGDTTISSGVLQFGNGGTTGNLGAGPITNNATLAFNRADNITVSNLLTTTATGGSISHRGIGTVTLTAANSLGTGATGITNGGTLVLDFTGLVTPTNIVGTGALTVLGNLNLLGKTAGVSSQTFSGTTFSAGASTVTVNSNGGTATNLALGTITRTIGGTVNFTLPSAGTITTTTANSGGILGGYATVGGTTWAVSAGDGTNAGAITGLATYGTDPSIAGADLDVISSGSLTANPNSIRFNTSSASTLNLTAARAIATGGILVTPNVGANLSQIAGAFTLTSGSGADLVVIQNNTAAGLTISANIGTSLTKSGDGLLTLTGGNVASPVFRINAGTISVASASPMGGAGGTGVVIFNVGSTGTWQLTGNNTFSSSKGFTLNGNGIIDVPVLATMTGTTSAAGSGNFTKTGAGTLVFSSTANANTYTGATILNQGTLQINTLADGGVSSGIGAATTAAANLVLNGGTLKYTGTTATSTNRLFTVGTAGGTLDASGTTSANTASFTGTGSIALTGTNTPRTLTLTGTNTGANTLAPSLGDNGTGATALLKSGVGSWTLAGANTYTGTTTVNQGTLNVTGSLAINNSSKVLMAAPSATPASGPVLTRTVSATANAFAGFGSRVTDASIESPLLTNTALQTTADILMSNINTDVDALSMQWRQRSVAEANPLNTNAVLSDVISITGMDNGADIFVLQMSYTNAALGSLNEMAIAASGELRLGWNDAGTWKTANAGNTVPGGTFAGISSWADFVTANGVTAANLNNFLGSYGVDPSSPNGGVVWAVLDHNSEFAVIPEPSTLVLGGLALLGLAGAGLRRRLAKTTT